MLLEKLNEDLKLAMKNKDRDRLDTIRSLKTALKNEEIKLQVQELTSDQELSILTKEVKQRKDSIFEFEKANRYDLIEKEKVQLAILEDYLPKQLTKEEVLEIVENTINSVNATSMKDMGKVMNALSPQLKGRCDMATVNVLVKEKLNK